MSGYGIPTARIRGELVTLVLVALAAVAWWLTALMDAAMAAGTMTMMSWGPFLVGWALMMAAMMLPAVLPVVRLYQRAAAAGRVAPTGFFVGAYLVVWALTGVPAFLLWRALAMPLSGGETWALRTAGATLVVAGAFQLTPAKRACLRHCRSPLSAFMRLRSSVARPVGAFRAGLLHGAYCCGCCAALMAVLVTAAAMDLWWALLLAATVFVERNVRWGTSFATWSGVALLALGTAVLLDPSLLTALI